MVNALQMLRDFQMQDAELASRREDRDFRNQLMRQELMFKQDANRRDDARLRMAQENAQRNYLAQQMGLQSKERMMGDRLRMQERIAQGRMNQPIWDAERGVFVQRPQAGMMPPGAGVIAPPNLPPRRNPEMEKMQAKAAFQLPEVLQQGEMAMQQIDQMIGNPEKKIPEHPGFQNAVGMPNLITGLGARVVPGLFPGSDTASFNKRLDQIKGGAFLQAFESLKGGGQITEVEGKKATEAITRMDTAQSEKEFKDAARELQLIIRKGMDNARRQAKTGGDRPAQPAAGGGFRVLGVEGR